MSNTSPNQQRNLKPTGSNPAAYSTSPTQLTLSSDTSSIGGFYNPYAQHYGHAPSPHHTTAFGFPQHPPYPQHIQTQTQPAAQAYPPQAQISPQVSRKRRATDDLGADALSATTNSSASAFPSHSLATGAAPADVDFGAPGTSQSQLPSPVAKKGRTNTPWTPAEEQRLKTLREAGSSWSEIAKTFPTRTEGSVKKHWYKDMHYAEFAEDEVSSFSAALLQAIKDYENNKWKVIGQKVGKPAKACEQFAKEQGWKI